MFYFINNEDIKLPTNPCIGDTASDYNGKEYKCIVNGFWIDLIKKKVKVQNTMDFGIFKKFVSEE